MEFQVKKYYKSEKKIDKKRINKEVKSFIKLCRETSTEYTLILKILLPPILKENGILLCEEDLTEEGLSEAISMAQEKTPANNGFTQNFYKYFQEHLKDIFVYLYKSRKM